MLHTMTDTQRDDMARIAAIVTLSDRYHYNGDDWDSYDLTITRAGRTYPVGQLTVYDNGQACFILKHYDVNRTAVQRKAWRALEAAFGLSELQPWETPRAWFTTDMCPDA